MQGGEVYLDRLYYASSGGGGSDIIKPTSEYLLLLDALRNLIERYYKPKYYSIEIQESDSKFIVAQIHV